MNLVIAVREVKANSDSNSTLFEMRRHNNPNHIKTLTVGSNDPINLTSLPTNPTSSYNNPWIFLEGTTESGIEYSQSTLVNNAGTLAPGEIETYTATYTISQDVFDSGGVSNSVTVSLQNPDGDTISDVSDDDGDDTNGGDTPTDDSFTQSPSAEVTKSVIIVDNGDSLDGLDDVLEYEIEIKNTGDVTLTNLSLIHI